MSKDPEVSKKEIRHKIGLSLGGDLCWPACYEEILKEMKLEFDLGDSVVTCATERVTMEPFNLQQSCSYSVVLDRLTHWFHLSREWVKKAIVMDDLYVLNNPWSIQSMEKHTTYAAMMSLGLPVPDTWLLPKRNPDEWADLEHTLRSYASQWDLYEIGEQVGYPFFMKPYDGGGWRGVSHITGPKRLNEGYASSGSSMMHLQKAVPDYDLFVRAVGIGPQVNVIKYDPEAPLHKRYCVDFNYVDESEWSLMTDMTLTINSYFGWDFNSCEALRSGGRFHPIDFANACPDSQVTSLHYHFPWLVKGLIRWSLFCAVTERKMRKTLDWAPYEAIKAEGLDEREALRRYGNIGRERFNINEFVDFCQTHLSHLDEVVLEFFQKPKAKEIIRSKVAQLFPKHEIDMFTNHFFGLIQFWAKTETDRLSKKPELPEGIYLGDA